MNRVNVLKWVLTSFGTLGQSSPINQIKSFDPNNEDNGTSGSLFSTSILIITIGIIFVIAVTIYRRSKKSIPKNNNYFALEPRNTLADDDILHRGLLTEEEEETAPSDDHVLRSNITRYKDDDGNLNQNEAFDSNDNDNQSVTSFVDTPVTFPEEQQQQQQQKQQRQNIFSIMDEEEDEENA
ncbi:hypothetical protein F8M41_021599 [Gigaspora margarita]|uniref:Uncharacterized protein n=1 Tax=Gigaspora margarita TaxID=4874 RepID=A0A8H4AGJ3_GIGMA|nr:hypothetical protein F8M41_021599 [Gigaspora margarita]